MSDITKELVQAYALENARKYGGKANQGAVLAGLFSEGLEKSRIKEVMPLIQEVMKEVNGLSLEEQEGLRSSLSVSASKREIREGLPELNNAVQGNVVMRIAPFPSGPLHIGNARALLLNDEYVKKYGGKLVLLFDDTIGSEEKPIEPDAYKLIEEGLKYLEVEYSAPPVYRSDRFEIYYQYAEEMLRKGYLYVCSCSREKIRENKEKGVECTCRQYPGQRQLTRWEEMKTAKEGTRVVRLKTSMSDPDPAFRDRIMFRISDRPHARTKNKYRVYPLLDFSAAIDDHLLGMTHILRGMELAMETRTEKFIWDIFGWPHPEIIYNGHFTIDGIKISKSKGSAEVRSGAYSGWDDPRTWSLQSLQKRGIVPQALKDFIISLGVKKTSITTPVEVLYSYNKKHLGPVKRLFFIENPSKIRIAGAPPFNMELPFSHEQDLGTRKIVTRQEFFVPKSWVEESKNKEYRLMHLLNFKSEKLLPLKPRHFSFTSENKSKGRLVQIPWIPAQTKVIETNIFMPDGRIKSGICEPAAKKVAVGEIIHFEQVGYCRLTKNEGDFLEFYFAHK